MDDPRTLTHRRALAIHPAAMLRLLRAEAKLLLGLAAAAMLALVFGGIASEVVEGDMAGFDRAVLSLFRAGPGLADPIGPAWVQEMGRDVTALGSFSCLGLLLAAVVGYLLLLHKRATAAWVLASVLGGVVLSTVLKLLFDRPRPDLPHAARVFTASFPSGHATLSAITFLTIGLLLTRVTRDRRLRTYVLTCAVVLSVLVGTSRVYLGVHHASDVLAGWVLGSAWAILCWAAAVRLQRRGEIEAPGVADAAPRPPA